MRWKEGGWLGEGRCILHHHDNSDQYAQDGPEHADQSDPGRSSVQRGQSYGQHQERELLNQPYFFLGHAAFLILSCSLVSNSLKMFRA